ncbi:hypothetical protein V5O48_002919 [Marasmius crinis-equi]|uniref:Zinc-finger domain-containing protein n=1 Tax=Marasmius crinis-equi TaxID=585013 RepID=A0ABR3FVB8_9AGAR
MSFSSLANWDGSQSKSQGTSRIGSLISSPPIRSIGQAQDSTTSGSHAGIQNGSVSALNEGASRSMEITDDIRARASMEYGSSPPNSTSIQHSGDVLTSSGRPQELISGGQDRGKHHYISPSSSSSSINVALCENINTAISPSIHKSKEQQQSFSARVSELPQSDSVSNEKDLLAPLHPPPPLSHAISPRTQAKRDGFATPPPLASTSTNPESLFTPPNTASLIDSLFTPPPSPPHCERSRVRKKKVQRLSHIAVPPFPLGLDSSDYLTPEEAGLSSPKDQPPVISIHKTESASRRKKPDSYTDVTLWTEAWAHNYTSSYPSASQLGLRRSQKKPDYLKRAVTSLAGADFEDERDDGDVETSMGQEEGDVDPARRKKKFVGLTNKVKRKRKRSPSYIHETQAESSHTVKKKPASKQVSSIKNNDGKRPTLAQADAQLRIAQASSPKPMAFIHEHGLEPVSYKKRPAAQRRASGGKDNDGERTAPAQGFAPLRDAQDSSLETPQPVHIVPFSPNPPSFLPQSPPRHRPSSLAPIPVPPEPDKSFHYVKMKDIVKLKIPSTWPPVGHADYSHLGMFVNTRFVRRRVPSGSISDPIVVEGGPVGQEEIEQYNADLNPTQTICPIRIPEPDAEDEAFFTPVLRFPPVPSVQSINPPPSSHIDLHCVSSQLPDELSQDHTNTFASTGKNPLRQSSHLRSASPKAEDQAAWTPADSFHELTHPHPHFPEPDNPISDAPSEKALGKGKALNPPLATYLPHLEERQSPPLINRQPAYPLSYHAQQSGATLTYTRFLSATNDPPPQVYTATHDDAPFLSVQPPSPITFTTTGPPDTIFDPVEQFLDLDDTLSDIARDGPVYGPFELDVSFGSSRPFADSLEDDPIIRTIQREDSRATIDPSIFHSGSPTLGSSEPGDFAPTEGAEEARTPSPPSPVELYDGAKLPPRSVSRVVSLKTRPPPNREASKSALASLQDYESSGSDEEEEVIDVVREERAGLSLSPVSGLFQFDRLSRDVVDSSSSSEDEYDNETSSSSSEDKSNRDVLDEVAHTPARRPTPQRGPYAHIIDMLPTKLEARSASRESQIWKKGTEAYFCHQLFLPFVDSSYDEDTFGFLKAATTFKCPACANWCSCDVCTARRGEVYVSLRYKPGPASATALRHHPRPRSPPPAHSQSRLPLIQATDTTAEPLDYWGPIYDASCENRIATGYIPSGKTDDVILADPLPVPRRRKKRKRRVQFIGTVQDGWKRPSKVVDKTSSETNRKRYYLGRKPPPPSALVGHETVFDRADSPLTDLDDEVEGESSFRSFWYSESNDENTGDEQGIPRSGLEYEKLYLSRRGTPYSQEDACDPNPPPPLDLDTTRRGILAALSYTESSSQSDL